MPKAEPTVRKFMTYQPQAIVAEETLVAAEMAAKKYGSALVPFSI